MKIIELPIEFEFNGQKNNINPSLIISKNELTLVDTGYPNFLPFIENEILKNGFEKKNLKNIIRRESYLFPSRNGERPITPTQAYRQLNKAEEFAGVEHVGNHTLGKTFGYWF